MELTEAGLVAVGNDGLGAFDGAKLRLFKNDFTPTKTTVNPASFTQADFTGYAEKTLTATTPTVAGNGDDDGEGTYTEQRWDATSSQTIYGPYIVNAAGTSVLAFGIEEVEVVSGAPVVITPKFIFKNPA